MDSNRYGVLAVTVMAVFVAALAALITRNSWADKDTTKSGQSVRLQAQTTTTFGALSTTSSLVPTTTIALPVPTTSTSAKPGTVPTIRPGSGTTIAPGATPTTRGTTPTTPTTKAPTGSFDQRSDNDASFRYGPNPQDRDAGTQGPTSSKGAMGYIVKGQAESESQWNLGAELFNNSGREMRFDGGIDAILSVTCNGKSVVQHLHDPSVTTMPPGGGVRLGAYATAIDPGPGTCTMYGTVKYATV